MPYIHLDGLQFPLEAGETRVGSGGSVHIPVGPGEKNALRAVITVTSDGGAIIAAGDAGESVLVNGVPLGATPAPLMHGDRIVIAGRELFFGDDRQTGNTTHVPSMNASPARARPTAARSTAASGGRLVSLVDGREYPVPPGGLVIGRDPTCGVVIPSGEVSRRHAVIAAGRDGYTLQDMSANGVLVNGDRAHAVQALGRGDVLRFGDEEFRFYADAAPPPRPVLATLDLLNVGAAPAARFEIRTALANVGRGAENDIVIDDDSVSEYHARLRKRAGDVWVVEDLGSTNGTYVGGRRIEGTQQLTGVQDVRFGGMKYIFRAVTREGETGPRTGPGRTRVIAPAKAGARAPSRGAPTPSQGAEARAPADARRPAPVRRGIPVVLWLLILVFTGAVAFFILTGR